MSSLSSPDVKGRNGIQFRRSCLDSVFTLPFVEIYPRHS